MGVLLLLCLVTPFGRVNADPLFAPHVDYGSAGQLSSVAIGDLDGDGNPDLVVGGGNGLSVLFGDGNGKFPTRVDLGTVAGVSSVAIGDLNGDGHLDLVATNYNAIALSVSLWLGNGDRTFAPRADYVTGVRATSVAIGDLDGDGKADLVTANTTQPTSLVSVLLGRGDGTFATKTDYATGTGPACVAIGDLNHDDKRDLAVANFNAGTVSVLLNISPTTAVPPAAPPARFALMLAGPNPARSAVSLAAALPRAASVDVAIYSLQGGLVRRLLAGGSLPAGIHPLVWDARDESGARAPRGVYFARMRADGIVSGRTTIVLR